jgi:4-diphosphocytidyl-2-C-methyl-D-erythritol kinase
MLLRAPAKLNLSLRVLGKRADGFHAIETTMVPLDFGDDLDIQQAEGDPGIEMTCSDPSLPVDEHNLVIKAYRALDQSVSISGSWRVHLHKHTPSGAGLGGGSSDAATLLLALNERLERPLDLPALSQVAAQVGSDVPFFLHRSACDATGRGEVVTPIPFPWRPRFLLIKPAFGVPTPWAYQRWAQSKELDHVRYSPQQCPWGEMVNELERPVFEKYVHLAALKMWLLEQAQVSAALMSGSGATMFAVLKEGADALALAAAAREHCGPETWIQAAQLAT